jgi:hypothetical protein
MLYDPPRQVSPKDTSHPLEVELVFNVRPCGTCDFFWPTDSPQPYGPYPAYDFLTDSPQTNQPPAGGGPFVWLDGIIRPATFPDAEVMDGCRKAPIMTIGINPNLTAFEAGTMGADWCYPSFSGQSSPDSWAKYAYYYRYRSVYQEHFGLHFIRPYLETEGQVIAAKPGVMKATIRTSDDPSYDIRVLYDGDEDPAAIHLAAKS